MRIEKRDGSRERQTVTAMILSPIVLGKISSRWENNIFVSRWANIVGKLCVDYYAKYGAAPRGQIENLFMEWGEHSKDKTTIEMVEKYLGSLSSEYENKAEEINPSRSLDVANDLFNQIRIKRLIEHLEDELSAGQIAKAIEHVEGFTKADVDEEAKIDLLQEQEEIAISFAQNDSDCLIEFPDDLGHFFGKHLERDGFIAFEGPEKSAKTFWLLELAWRAMLQRHRVAFFEVGDLSKRQLKLRLLVRAAKHPFYSNGYGWPYTLKYPIAISYDSKRSESAVVTYKKKTYEKPLNQVEALEACTKIMKEKIRSKRSYLRLSVHPNSSINVLGIRSILDQWRKQDNFLPEVVCIDYSDILAPPSGKMDFRDQINTTWKQLRGLSQDLHCLVLTATQADADAYSRKLLDRSNFSEDKRKLSHVTGLVGINVTAEEKERGIMRLNWIVLREGEFSSRKCVHVAGCLALANPAVCSCF